MELKKIDNERIEIKQTVSTIRTKDELMKAKERHLAAITEIDALLNVLSAQ